MSTFPVTVWRYHLRLELEGTDRESLPQCLEAEELGLFRSLPREEVYRRLRDGLFVFTQSYEEPLTSFAQDLGTISVYLFQVVAGLEVAERYTDEKTTDDARAWKVVAQRGEWVKVPLVVEGRKGRFAVDTEKEDLEVIAAHWREYPRWFQDGMRFRYPKLREL